MTAASSNVCAFGGLLIEYVSLTLVARQDRADRSRGVQPSAKAGGQPVREKELFGE